MNNKLETQLATLIKQVVDANEAPMTPLGSPRHTADMALYHEALHDLAWWVVKHQDRIAITPPPRKTKLVEFKTEDGHSIIHEVK